MVPPTFYSWKWYGETSITHLYTLRQRLQYSMDSLNDTPQSCAKLEILSLSLSSLDSLVTLTRSAFEPVGHSKIQNKYSRFVVIVD